MGGCVYIATNRTNGVLYVGVTSDIKRRAWEHRTGAVSGFSKKYGLNRLVYVEHHENIGAAIQREKNIKHWRRSWKVHLIHSVNSDWDDLYDSLS